MTRILKTTGLATFVLLAGCLAPAAAQPIPPEGPAIDPAVYKVPAGAKTVNVDCDDQKQTLGAAVSDRAAADLNIVFTGTCKENFSIMRDNVAIRGKDATATIVGSVEVNSAKRVLLENFTCRDNTQIEYCIGAVHGASVSLHNIKVQNAAVRGVMILNSVAVIEGLNVDKTLSTSILIRGSDVRLEGEQTFAHTLEGCVVVDNVSSVFSKSGVFNARDCGSGILVQSNSNFHAPFATFNLNANSLTGLMLLTSGTFSYGGQFTAKNNTLAGVFADDGSSFSPFTNIVGGSTLTLENNGTAGILVRSSFAEVVNVTANTGSKFGMFVEDGRIRIGRGGKATDNKTADIRLTFGSKAVFLEGSTIGTLSCDGTEMVRGNKVPCTQDKDSEAKPTVKPTTETKPAAKPDSAPVKKQ